MAASRHPLELEAGALARHCTVDHFTFKDTSELPNMREIIGQPRGVRAIEFGIDMVRTGYNIYVMGARGTGRLTAIERFIQARATDDPVPDDVLYVNNFEAQHQPYVLLLPAGKGSQFAEGMRELVRRLQAEIPRAFEAQTFTDAVQEIKRTFQEKRDQILQHVQTVAGEKGFVLRSAQGGMMLAPVKDGQAMTPEDYEQLAEDERVDLERRRHELEDMLTDALRQSAEIDEQAQAVFENLQRTTTATILDTVFGPLTTAFAAHEKAAAYLTAVRNDVLANVGDFLTGGESAGEDGEGEAVPAGEAGQINGLRRYAVNLLVDHSKSEGAPVVVVSLPTYQNLMGRIEHRMQYGAMTTDFTMIKPGALFQANGGYLVVRALDILQQPFAWEALKRSLNSAQVCIEEPESRGTSVMTTQMLEPEPIPLNVKVIMLGSPAMYYGLFEQEEDFPELFKVKADFAATMDRDADSELQYAAFVATRCHEDNLPHFDAAAVGRVIDYGTWLADDQGKLSTRFGEITDLIREAAYFASLSEHEIVSAEHVAQAIEERRYRNNLYEELSHRQILDGDILVVTEGTAVGQINGLTVLQLGDYSFGQPSRITARVFMGESGVVQIEREVEMTGPIHDKGVLILRGYLGSTYAQDFPLSLGASLTFEQNYGGVEGDSASSTELYALLSALSGLPIRQDLAVTGSVDQRGVVQPIGGATQKIEGFFRICQGRGLTGTQGVLIPRINVRSLMLNDEVQAAVETGQFHIYAIEHIDQGIELLTGVPAGERQPDGTYLPDTVHHAVYSRLRALAEGLRGFTAPVVTINTGE